jgi:RimJ/RimL family protein N-acetyltransferase
LYKAFIQTADQLGVRRIEWVVLNWNKTAIDFYEKSGAKILADWQTVQMAQENIKQFISEN